MLLHAARQPQLGFAPGHEGEALEQHDVLFVFQQRAVQRGGWRWRGSCPANTSSGISSFKSSLSQSSSSLVEGLFLQPRNVAQVIEDIHRLLHQHLLDAGEVDIDESPASCRGRGT